jgi:hypothetical protein
MSDQTIVALGDNGRQAANIEKNLDAIDTIIEVRTNQLTRNKVDYIFFLSIFCSYLKK